MLALRLEWSRCVDGVELYDTGKPHLSEPPEDAPEGWLWPQSGLQYRERSKNRVPVVLDALNLENPVILHFVNAKSDADFSAFFARFGFLDRNTNMLGKQTDQRNELAYESALNWHRTIRNTMHESLGQDAELRSKRLNNLLNAVDLKPSVDMSGEGGRARITLRPATLLQFMCMEAATASINEVSAHSCEHCGKVFFTGALTGRRAHAVYCSDRCRVAAMRKRNAEGSGGG